MSSDIVFLILGLLGLVAIFGASYWYLFRSDNALIPEETREEAAGGGTEKKMPKVTGKVRRGKNKSRRGLDAMRKSTTSAAANGEDAEDENDQSATGDSDEVWTKKQMKKAEKLREKQEMREAEEAAREANEARKDSKSSKYKKKEEERERLRLEAEEEAKQQALEAERKAEEEFNEWKDMFTVENEGSNENDVANESQGQLQEFVDYIINKKVVMLEELAAEFDLRTQEAINRVQALEKMGRITGVFDDRGKFIYISREEMDKVATFITKKGRISISALAVESNKLVNLKPGPTTTRKKPQEEEIQEQKNEGIV